MDHATFSSSLKKIIYRNQTIANDFQNQICRLNLSLFFSFSLWKNILDKAKVE